MNTGWHEYNVEGEAEDRDRTAEDLAERYAPSESVVATRFLVSDDPFPSAPTRVRFWARADSTEIEPIPQERVDRAAGNIAVLMDASPKPEERARIADRVRARLLDEFRNEAVYLIAGKWQKKAED